MEHIMHSFALDTQFSQHHTPFLITKHINLIFGSRSRTHGQGTGTRMENTSHLINDSGLSLSLSLCEREWVYWVIFITLLSYHHHAHNYHHQFGWLSMHTINKYVLYIVCRKSAKKTVVDKPKVFIWKKCPVRFVIDVKRTSELELECRNAHYTLYVVFTFGGSMHLPKNAFDMI